MQAESTVGGSTAAPDQHGQPPGVSVIIIFLNGEQFIEEAIESVFAQTWPHWELLLVDDGSTDRSTTIARSYAQRHPERVRYLEHPGHVNRGMSASRNLGIAHARGRYIAFLDADDAYLPHRLAKHIAVFDAEPAVDVVQSAQMHWYSWAGNREEDHLEPSVGPLGVITRPTLMLRWLLSTEFGVNIGSLTIRREAIAEVGGFENAFTSFYEDIVFRSKLYATKNILVLDECLALYRRHPSSVIVRALEERGGLHRDMVRAHRAYLIWLNSFLRDRGIKDPWFEATIERRLRLVDEQIRRCGVEEHRRDWSFGPALRRLARLVTPTSVIISRRNRLRERKWRQARSALERLRGEIEVAGGASPRLEASGWDPGNPVAGSKHGR